MKSRRFRSKVNEKRHRLYYAFKRVRRYDCNREAVRDTNQVQKASSSVLQDLLLPRVPCERQPCSDCCATKTLSYKGDSITQCRLLRAVVDTALYHGNTGSRVRELDASRTSFANFSSIDASFILKLSKLLTPIWDPRYIIRRHPRTRKGGTTEYFHTCTRQVSQKEQEFRNLQILTKVV